MVKPLIPGIEHADTSSSKALDRRYVMEMKRLSKSQDPAEAKIARQGLALRRSSMKAQESLCSKVPMHGGESPAKSFNSGTTASLITIVEGDSPDALWSSNERALARRDTSATELDSDEDIQELFSDIQKRQRTLKSRFSSVSEDGDFVERLLAGVGLGVPIHAPSRASPYVRGIFVPSRIPPPLEREMNNVDFQLRVYGSSHWFCTKQQLGLEAKTYHEAPPAVQRRLIKAAIEPDLVLHFPNWRPFETVGLGKYRVAADLPESKVVQTLLKCMGDLADLVGGFGPGIPIEGHSDIDFHTLLCMKYEKEMHGKIRPPQEEIVNGVLVIRGFPLDFETKWKTAETFLRPLTYEAFNFMEPRGRICEHRIAHYHVWTGEDVPEEDPDRYTLENTYPIPKPQHDWANLPYHMKFTNPAEPSYYVRPGRHSRLQDSDLEALEARNEPPMPDEVTMRANALFAQAKAIPNAQPRPPIARKISDKTKKVRVASALLGKKRTLSTGKQADGKEESGDEKGPPVKTGEPSTKSAAVEPGAPSSHSVIAQPLHHPGQARNQSQALSQRPGLQRSKSKVNQPANKNKSKKKDDSTPNTKGQKALNAAAQPTSKADYSIAANRQENPVPSSSGSTSPTDAILDLYNHSSVEESGSTRAPTPQDASPPLRSILIKQANTNVCMSRAQPEKRGICWASDIACPSSDRSFPVPIQSHRAAVPSVKQPHWTDHFNSVSPKSPPSMAVAIKEIEAARQSGIAFSTKPIGASRGGVSAVAEMARSMTKDKEVRMAASGRVDRLADYGTALQVLKEVTEEHEEIQKREELARSLRIVDITMAQDREDEVLR